VWQEDKGFPKPVLLIRDVFPDPGSNFFLSLIPVPRSEFFPFRIRIPDRIKEFKYFNPKKWFLSSRKYEPGCSFQIPDPDPDFIHPGYRIQRSKRHQILDPQYYAKPIYQFHGIDAWGPEKFENSGSGSLSLHTNVCTLKNPRCGS
jgi:hypothetical protein